jgi:hypothetical protein
MPVLAVFFCTVSRVHMGPMPVMNVTSIEKRWRWGGGGCLADAQKRRHRGEATQSKERDATPDLLLKYSDATLATYVV